MARYIITCFLSGLCAMLCMLQPARCSDRITERRTVTLNAVTITIAVDCDSGRKAWADYILDCSRPYLKALEDYLGQNFEIRRKGGFTVSGQQSVVKDGVWYGGYTDFDTIMLEYRIAPVGNPALYYHELGHYWLNNGPEDSQWLVEGMVSFLPLAMREGRYIKPQYVPSSLICEHWGLRCAMPAKAVDTPVINDFRNNRALFSLFYIKTFRIQYMLHRELGSQNYRYFVRDVLACDSCVSSEEALIKLNHYKKMDWRAYLSGWVFPGSYTKYSMESFRKGDI